MSKLRIGNTHDLINWFKVNHIDINHCLKKDEKWIPLSGYAIKFSINRKIISSKYKRLAIDFIENNEETLNLRVELNDVNNVYSYKNIPMVLDVLTRFEAVILKSKLEKNLKNKEDFKNKNKI